MTELAKLTRDGDVGVVTLNNPPVNALSTAVAEQILDAVETLRGDASVRAVVLIGGGRAFCGGADINKFGQITSGQVPAAASPIPRLLEAVEQFPKPVVCAIHGFAFGGGLELAMACHYRVGGGDGAGRSAGGQDRAHSGSRRHATAAAAGRRGQGGGDVRRRQSRRRGRGTATRASSTGSSRETCSRRRPALRARSWPAASLSAGRATSRRSFAIRWPTTWNW